MDQPENISIHSLLPFVQPGMKTCEIGVRSGQSSQALLEKGCFVYMIDPWEDYDGYDEKNYYYDRDWNDVQEMIKAFPGQYEIIRKKSDDAKDDVPNDLDLVYIDGNHGYEFVKRDIYNYWPKLKDNGLLCGDDWSMPEVYKALTEFVKEISDSQNPISLGIFGRNWMIAKNNYIVIKT